MSIMLDHNDDVFRCLRGTMHVHRNAVVSIALSCWAAVAGRAAELLSADINRGSRNLIFSTVITFAQILSRGNSVLFVIVAFIQNNAQQEESCVHNLPMVISDWCMWTWWDQVEVGDYGLSLPPGDGEGRSRVTSEERKPELYHYQADLHLWWPICTRTRLIMNLTCD